MQREEMKDLLWFLEVAREQSFTKAAAKLGTSQSTLSLTIKQLEARLGVRLLARTTRSVAPTEAGERLFRSLAPRIEEIDADLASLTAYRDTPSGTVRLTLSDHALQTTVWPKLCPVLKNYPDIRVELYSDNGMRNIVEERYDAGVRLGESIDKDMIAVRIGADWRMVAVASPQYLAQRSIPVTPQDLVGYDCINQRQATAGGLAVWEFEKDGRELRVRVEGQLTFNTSFAIIDAALNEYGIAFLPEDLVRDHVVAGRLILLLDDWSEPFSGYHLYYPSRRQMSPAMTVILETLRYKSPSATGPKAAR
ncbi:LysR family transcriptional regulator [Mesorhizobium sp. STM 4661]|uniref:LysR family transcriptional regulator n=1 Tax=Mesorhizobium sp. STM 4661 TaxID=1297570 RepID=UPI0002BD8234|nr:LysR family transcriptional regulator [Mesorhizobium sp. STM 4661]CCV16519.1 putative nucleic acid-binding regulator [Mesorhizobium sp. STM 4661]